MHKVLTAILASGFAVALAATPARGQPLDGTLAKVKQLNEISLGYRDVSVPFSYLDDRPRPVGFAMDLCHKVVDAVQARLKLPALRTKLVPIQLSNQIPLIQNGTIDLVCGPATNTLEREKVVAFSDTIFVSSIRAVVRRDSPIKSFKDLNGKVVALTSASTSIGLLNAYEKVHDIKTVRVLSADHAGSFLALTTGRAEAFVMDDILLASMVANSEHPDQWRLLDDALRVEPYGLILRKNDPQFKALVDDTLVGLMRSGEFQALYDKWFTQAIPPKGLNLNFPMTQPLKDAIATPNDKGI